MLRRGHNALAVAALAVCMAGITSGAGCSATKPTELVPGALTQVEVPKDLSGLRVVVLANGATKFDQSYDVQEGIALLPATLGVVAGGSASTTVTIIVGGYDKNGVAGPNFRNQPQPMAAVGDPMGGPRVRRGSVQTYVDQKILFVPLPLSYSCWGFSGCPNDDPSGDGTGTCKGASCTTAKVDANTLPEFDPSLLDGTQVCFSPSACFADAVSALALNKDNCTYTFPETPPGKGLNVRIFYEDLTYDMTSTPPKLVKELPSAEEEVLNVENASAEGFIVPDPHKPQVFRLAPGLCSLVQAGVDPVDYPSAKNAKVPPSGILHAITDVQVASACQSKLPLLPFCANEQNPQGHGADGGPSTVICNAPISLQPAPSAIYLVMDDSAVMSAAFGTEGYATAMSLSLSDPLFKRTYVAFNFFDHQLSDCTASTTPYTTPSVDFGLANAVQPKIAAQLLSPTPPDTKNNPLPLNLQTALRLDQGAFKALLTEQTNVHESLDIGAIMAFVNRIPDSTGGADGGGTNPFPGADCNPALGGAPDAKTAIEQEIQAATAAGLRTYFVVLNDDSMLGPQVLAFYDQIASDLSNKGVTVLDATAPKAAGGGVPQAVLSKFSQTVTQLGTCLYELPPGIDTSAKLTFTIPIPVPPITSSAPTPVGPIPLAASCNAANQQSANGWNVDGTHIRICGQFCNELQQSVEAVTAATLLASPDGGLANVPEVPVTAVLPCADAGH
jgi:hypothetical protein